MPRGKLNRDELRQMMKEEIQEANNAGFTPNLAPNPAINLVPNSAGNFDLSQLDEIPMGDVETIRELAASDALSENQRWAHEEINGGKAKLRKTPHGRSAADQGWTLLVEPLLEFWLDVRREI